MEEYFDLLQKEHDLRIRIDQITEQKRQLDQQFSDTLKEYQKIGPEIESHPDNPKVKRKEEKDELNGPLFRG